MLATRGERLTAACAVGYGVRVAANSATGIGILKYWRTRPPTGGFFMPARSSFYEQAVRGSPRLA
jgi:hypothetical protein